MKKLPKKQLSLSTQKIRVLQTEDLAQANGGSLSLSINYNPSGGFVYNPSGGRYNPSGG